MERSKNRVIFTGTFVAKKGVIPLIKAWPRVLESCQDAELHMFGKDGLTDDGQSMQTYLLSLLNGQAKKSVHIYGHVAREKLFEALGTARVAVFPSYAETYGIAPFEAMTCGCPTIYTKRPPGPELIRDGMALLVDPDQPGEIADAIVRVLKDDALAQSLGVEGRKRVKESYSVEALLPQNEAFFESCLRDFRKVPVHA
jgi:glycosyltransferase involved in cell wall biosynthesis